MDQVSIPSRAKPRNLGLTWSDLGIGLLLAVIMLAGGYLRFIGQNWDDYVRFHPDERFLSGVVTAMNGPLNFTDSDIEGQYARCLERYPAAGGRGGFFDAQCSPMNPHNTGNGLYVYGTLPSFVVRWAADLAVQVTGDPIWGGYNGVHLIGRTLSALAEVGVILTVFFIGRQLHGRGVGLLAAGLYAFTVFSIQQAHFWTADSTTNLFVTLGIWWAVRVADRGGWWAYLSFGLAFGAALASRINTFPLALVLATAAGLRLLPALDWTVSWRERRWLIEQQAAGLVIAGVATLVIFRLFNPYAFLGPGIFGLALNPRWLQDLAEARHLVSGNAESPPNWQWVARTRYLFPFMNMTLWGMGIALGAAGWLSWLWSGWRLLRGRPLAVRNLLPLVWILVYFGWLGNNWVMSMRYYLPMYPMFALLAAWGLLHLVRQAQGSAWRRMAARGLLAAVGGFTILWALMFTNIYRNLFTPAQASYWILERVPADFSMELEGAAPDTPLINIAVYNPPGGEGVPLELQASRYETGQPFTTVFTAPADGVITKVSSPHLGQLYDGSLPAQLRVTIGAPDGSIVLAEGGLTARLPRDRHVLGEAYDIALSESLPVQGGETYQFRFEVVAGGPVISAGAVFAWEGDWDEVVPPKVCRLPGGMTLAARPPAGLSDARSCDTFDPWAAHINGHKLQVYWEEEPYKRDRFLQVLEDSDYLIIGTNRRYDSQARIPYRWPMTMAYYRALFDGSLGFERAATFHETFEWGPLRVSDQHLPFYGGPEWLNEYEAEEAFHVYDHPAVMIFRKTPAYSAETTRTLLSSVPLNKPEVAVGSFNDPTLVGVVPLYSLPASAAPTFLHFTQQLREIQYGGGTWSERFFREAPVNAQPALTLVFWWGALLVFGWAAWPLLFALFPGLADRGYGFAKVSGLLLVGWLAWLASSVRLPLWSQSGVLLALAAVALCSAAFVWPQRHALRDYLRQHGARLLWIEAITLLAFAFFLIIRLTNPDLWHPSFGGEKPMDFAYFNGVLRSTVFPPIDPWHANGYINYYYWGYVLVGSPVLLLGVEPSIAYNLIIPTLFALTGIGAFAVAYNAIAAWNARQAARDAAHPAANPWLAGLAALLLAVVLGNLDTPRVFVAEGLTRTGFYQQPQALQEELVRQYSASHGGAAPDNQALAAIIQQALEESNSASAGAWRGLTRLLQGQPLDIAPNRWYWAPTRILSEPPVNSGGAIVEMPFFTFLYGDLHAHMIAMPMMLLAMGFVLNEVLLAGRDPRKGRARWAALAVGAGTIGLLRATNTWDWITFTLLGVVGLAYAWWLVRGRLGRAAVLALAARVGGFVLLNLLLALPYTTWYAAVYSRAMPWSGPRSPLWTYFTIHGLFLFLIVSLLVWDTVRWLNSVYVRSLRGKLPALAAGVALVAGLLGVMLFLALNDYPVTIVAGPLILWIAVLFFRQGQTREVQYVLALAGLALSLTLGVEFVVLEGDVGRQNTVFKFYIQAWLLFSAAGGAAVAWLFASASRWPLGLRFVWGLAGWLLVTAAALYPVMATRGRALDRMANTPLSLDGMAFMQEAMLYEGDPTVLQTDPTLAPFALASDYELIRWLHENIEGTPVIMEGQSDREYRWQSRIAIYTGLPSVIGWNFHQRQQRTFDPMPRLVQQRVANVNAFYSLPDISSAWEILRHYGVSYVIVGALERAYYPAEGLAKFQRMVEHGLLEVVYNNSGAVVYKVTPDVGIPPEEVIVGGI